jgi:hypothetical protein
MVKPPLATVHMIQVRYLLVGVLYFLNFSRKLTLMKRRLINIENYRLPAVNVPLRRKNLANDITTVDTAHCTSQYLDAAWTVRYIRVSYRNLKHCRLKANRLYFTSCNCNPI